MAQPSGTLGSKLFITDTAIADTIDTEAEFMAQNWTEVGLIESFGEFGRQFDLASFQAIADGRMFKLKAGYNEGNIALTLAQALDDSGQAILKTAANLTDQSNYGFRIELNDPPSSVGGPTMVFFRGLAMSYRTQMGAVNAVVRVLSSIEINSAILTADPAELYDRFVTGGSLSAWALFNGSDAESLDPAISANALACVSGDAGTGFAADGSQAIASSGFMLSSGALVIEARLKLSAITNVGPVFFGLTDQKAALEAPIESAASSDNITTNATDGVGFMFDTAMSTDNWWLVGVNNDVDETKQNVGSAPVAATYVTLRLELNTSGDCVFKMDGVVVGSTMTTACRTSVTLYPTVCVGARSTASRTLTVDYVYARQS